MSTSCVACTCLGVPWCWSMAVSTASADVWRAMCVKSRFVGSLMSIRRLVDVVSSFVGWLMSFRLSLAG